MGGHLSTRQYARLVDEWVTAIGLTLEEYGTHSLRRTKASLIYKATLPVMFQASAGMRQYWPSRSALRIWAGHLSVHS